MITIQSFVDLGILEISKCPEPLRGFLGELLKAMEAEVDSADREDHLRRNPIILCERGDDLPAIIDASPFGHEYVERVEFGETMAYRIGVLLDNESFVQYLVPAIALDKDTEAWLADNTDSEVLIDEQK